MSFCKDLQERTAHHANTSVILSGILGLALVAIAICAGVFKGNWVEGGIGAGFPSLFLVGMWFFFTFVFKKDQKDHDPPPSDRESIPIFSFSNSRPNTLH